MTSPRFTGIVLAGCRGQEDPVSKAANVPCKALARVGGRPMVLRVMDALAKSNRVDQRILCGPAWSDVETSRELCYRVTAGQILWVQGAATASESAQKGLRMISDDTPILITTADHALLQARIVDHFCDEALKTSCDLVIGLARAEEVRREFPTVKRTVLRFSDDEYHGCNLYAVLTPQARVIAQFWRGIETQRKNPLRIIRAAGWLATIRFLAGRLSLVGALNHLGKRLGLRVGVVILPFAEAAIDVDKKSDLEFAQAYYASKKTLAKTSSEDSQ